MTLSELRGKHWGRTFILGNGPSLTDHNLSKVPEPTFGVNRSFKVRASTYHVALDHLTFREHGDELRKLPHVFSTDDRFPPDHADYVIPLRNLGDAIGWSWDMERGVYPRFSTYAAMQIAVWMGFDDIVLLGTDLMGLGSKGHFFSEGPLDNPWIGDARFQSECFGYAAGLFEAELDQEFPRACVQVRIVSDVCPLRCFPKVKFEEVTS